MAHTEYIWSFQPEGFFEELPSIDNAHFEGQHIYVRIDEPMSDLLREQCERKVAAAFAAEQSLSFKSYELTFVGHRSIGDDGTIQRSLIVGTAHMTLEGATMHMVGTVNGAVVRDTKAERRAERAKLMEQYARHANDPTLKRIIASRNAAVKDPEHELFRLHDIQDALETRLANGLRGREAREAAGKALGLSQADVDPLSGLANRTPVVGSRHSGQFKQLRPATKGELIAARRAADKMIRAYLDYLDRSTGNT